MAEDLDLEAELLGDSVRPAPCKVCQWLDGRDDADQWDRVFANPTITKAAILRGMQRRGFAGEDSPVATHRTRKHRVA